MGYMADMISLSCINASDKVWIHQADLNREGFENQTLDHRLVHRSSVWSCAVFFRQPVGAERSAVAENLPELG